MPTLPTQAGVAGVIPQRTGDDAGVVADSFGATTVPTADQVTGIIAELGAEVDAAVGAVPAALDAMWRWVVTLGSAAQVETSFYPDVGSGDALWARYAATLALLRQAVATANGAGTTGQEVLPVFGYPALDGINPITTLLTRF